MESNILVRDVMSKNLRVVREDTSIQEVVATMSKFDIDVVVVLRAHKPVGIITVKDALFRGFEHGLPISALTAKMVYTSPVKTIDQQDTVEEASEIMRANQIKHLPVTSNGRLVGMLTDMDIVYAMPRMLGMLEEVCHPQKTVAA